MQAAAITYRVLYGIPAAEPAPKPGRGEPSMRWKKCSVHFPHSGKLPDGGYFLYTEEGKVLQLKSVRGQWHCLALAA